MLRVHAGPSLASSGGPLGWGLLGGVFLGLLTMGRKSNEQSGKKLENNWKKTGNKTGKTSGKQEMFDMCFLGVFLGAPGGPPAASLGGPRGHGREEGGETAAIS